ncbi:hypothetical protein IAR55_005343 [Kwoniella newhampshirensis]|uniref:Pentatricopeptide repeat protein n=1 Tax=Kwoniella newhampshirensis TaxID=1651941 RepID=A0AAW0YH80_9TREE
MQGSASRQLIRRVPTLLRSSSPQPSRPTCPACAFLHTRCYAFATRPQRPRKILSEFSSVPKRDPGPSSSVSSLRLLSSLFRIVPTHLRLFRQATSSSNSSSTDSLLRSRFLFLFPTRSAPSSPQLDVQQVIQIAYPLIFRRGLRELLDPQLVRISNLISDFVSSPSAGNLSDEDRRLIISLLGHSFLRVMGENKDLFSAEEKIRVADNYSNFLVSEIGRLNEDVQRLESLQSRFEDGLARLAKTAKACVELFASVVAIWTILRVKLGYTEAVKSTFIWPPLEKVQQHVQKAAQRLGEEPDDYLEGISSLVRPNGRRLPRTTEALEKELTTLRMTGDVDGLIKLWTSVRDRLASSTTDDVQAEPMLDPKPDIRYAVLALFLRAFKRSSISNARTAAGKSLDVFADQVLALCPRPLPRAIAYALMALRARPNDNAFRSGQEVESLDYVDDQGLHDVGALENLKATWKEIGERDVKLYMMYIEGLGRWGDLDGLQMAWNELVQDIKCRELYYAEEAKGNPSAPFPPIQALNHMISAALLVPSTGPAVAINLFEQASQPASSVPCNLITINTMLRHHARQADLQGMTSLFALADKLNLKPDVVTYTTLIQGLLRAGRIDLAKSTLSTMHSQGISPNERMCSMLIADLAKSGTKIGLQHAEDLLKLMLHKGMKTNEVTWTALIAGYFNGGWEKDGWDTINRMTRTGLRLNRVGYNVLFRQARGLDIMALWRRMERDGVTPNSDSYLLVLTHLVKGERWHEVAEVMGEMKKRGFRPEKGALSRLVGNIKARG